MTDKPPASSADPAPKLQTSPRSNLKTKSAPVINQDKVRVQTPVTEDRLTKPSDRPIRERIREAFPNLTIDTDQSIMFEPPLIIGPTSTRRATPPEQPPSSSLQASQSGTEYEKSRPGAASSARRQRSPARSSAKTTSPQGPLAARRPRRNSGKKNYRQNRSYKKKAQGTI